MVVSHAELIEKSAVDRSPRHLCAAGRKRRALQWTQDRKGRALETSRLTGGSAGVPPYRTAYLTTYDERHKHHAAPAATTHRIGPNGRACFAVSSLVRAAARHWGRRRFAPIASTSRLATGRRHTSTGAVRVGGGTFRRSRLPHTPPGLLHSGRTAGASAKP